MTLSRRVVERATEWCRKHGGSKQAAEITRALGEWLATGGHVSVEDPVLKYVGALVRGDVSMIPSLDVASASFVAQLLSSSGLAWSQPDINPVDRADVGRWRAYLAARRSGPRYSQRVFSDEVVLTVLKAINENHDERRFWHKRVTKLGMQDRKWWRLFCSPSRPTRLHEEEIAVVARLGAADLVRLALNGSPFPRCLLGRIDYYSLRAADADAQGVERLFAVARDSRHVHLADHLLRFLVRDICLEEYEAKRELRTTLSSRTSRFRRTVLPSHPLARLAFELYAFIAELGDEAMARALIEGDRDDDEFYSTCNPPKSHKRDHT